VGRGKKKEKCKIVNYENLSKNLASLGGPGQEKKYSKGRSCQRNRKQTGEVGFKKKTARGEDEGPDVKKKGGKNRGTKLKSCVDSNNMLLEGNQSGNRKKI